MVLMKVLDFCSELFGDMRHSTEEEKELYENMLEGMLTGTVIDSTLVRCTHCGESYYSHKYSTSTCMHWEPVFKDGVLINKNPNKTTNHCHCLNCGKDFSYTD